MSSFCRVVPRFEAEISMRGIECDGGAVLRFGEFKPCLSSINTAEGGMSVGIFGVDIQRLHKFEFSGIILLLEQIDFAQRDMGTRVAGRGAHGGLVSGFGFGELVRLQGLVARRHVVIGGLRMTSCDDHEGQGREGQAQRHAHGAVSLRF